jgi:hypothetical protein
VRVIKNQPQAHLAGARLCKTVHMSQLAMAYELVFLKSSSPSFISLFLSDYLVAWYLPLITRSENGCTSMRPNLQWAFPKRQPIEIKIMLKKLGLSVLLLSAQNGAEAAVRDFTLHIDNGNLTIADISGTTLLILKIYLNACTGSVCFIPNASATAG